MATNKLIYQFRVELLEIEPSIWRRIQVFEKFDGGVRVRASLAVCASFISCRTAEGELVLLTLYAKAKTDNLTGTKLKDIRRALEQ